MTDLSAQARFLSSYEWSKDRDGFGGYSAITMSPDGTRFTLLSDRAHTIDGTLFRQGDRILGVRSDEMQVLDYPVSILGTGYSERDTEGMARDADGRLYISLETDNRVIRRDIDGTWSALPPYSAISGLPPNKGLEALAITQDGALVALPEKVGRSDTMYPVFRYRDEIGWDTPYAISRVPSYQPVGADFDPMGRLYILERGFAGIGFFSQVRRFTLVPDTVTEGEILLQSRTRQHDNLEGIAVWTAPDGELRVTLVSDDNFLSIQKTEIVEYAIPK